MINLGLRLAGLGLLAFFAAGFSEVALTLQAGLLAAGILAAFLLRRRDTLWPLAAALGGTGLAGIVLVSAPMNQARLVASYGAPNTLAGALILALDSTRTFIQLTLYRETVPYLFSGVFFFLLGAAWLANRAGDFHLSIRRALGGLALLVALGLALIYASVLPGAYAESSYPGDRVLVIGRYISLLVSAGCGLILGGVLLELSRRGRWGFLLPGGLTGGLAGTGVWILAAFPLSAGEPDFPALRAALQTGPGLAGWAAAAGGGLLVGCLLEAGLKRGGQPSLGSPALAVLGCLLLVCQLGYADQRLVQDAQPLERRAVLWDGRDAQIRQLALDSRTLTVPALDSLAGILELQENPGNWVNQCAASYYGLESLRAVQPILK